MFFNVIKYTQKGIYCTAYFTNSRKLSNISIYNLFFSFHKNILSNLKTLQKSKDLI